MAAGTPDKLISPVQLARRTAGGHRRIPFEQAVELLREQRPPVIDPAALEVGGETAALGVSDAHDAGTQGTRALHALLRGRPARAAGCAVVVGGRG